MRSSKASSPAGRQPGKQQHQQHQQQEARGAAHSCPRYFADSLTFAVLPCLPCFYTDLTKLTMPGLWTVRAVHATSGGGWRSKPAQDLMLRRRDTFLLHRTLMSVRSYLILIKLLIQASNSLSCRLTDSQSTHLPRSASWNPSTEHSIVSLAR